MSTTATPAKKTTAPASKRKSDTPGTNVANDAAIRLRLFDPRREKREYNLDVAVLEQLAAYEAYLYATYGQKPATNKVLELLLDVALSGETGFQNWRKEQPKNAPPIIQQTPAAPGQILDGVSN